MKVYFGPEAREEFLNSIYFYEAARKGLGESFRLAIEAASLSIAQRPLLWRKLRGDVRRCLVRGFPYALVYVVEPTRVYVVAVMHLRRKPGYWRKRLP